MKTYTYLREYSNEGKEELTTLLQSSLDLLPFTLSAPIEKLAKHVEKENYGSAMNHALDFFEITVQYLSCVLIALVQREEELQTSKHPELIKAINRIDIKRPLSFGDWINDIFFPVLKAAKDRLPHHELVRSLLEQVITGGGNLLTGDKKNSSIVQIRNEYKGHSTTLSEDIYKGVVYTLEPRIFQMLKAVAPLREWKYFSCKEQIAPDRFKVNCLNGFCDSGREEVVETDQALQVAHYYIQEKDGKQMDLFPLFFSNEKHYIYVFQSLKEESASYISSNENAVTYIDDCFNEEIDKFFQKTLPSFDIAKDLNWEEIKKLTDQTSRKFLGHAYKEKKYNRELFVDRSILTSFFTEFQESEKTLFPMLGEAGQGKTNQLCYWTELLMEQNKGVLIFNSAGFAEATLEEKLKNIFGFNKRKAVKKLLDNIHNRATDSDKTVCFFFDAINECLSYKGATDNSEGPLDLYRDIRSLLISEEYPLFKVLFTCRNYTWKNLIQPHVASEDTSIFQSQENEEIAVRGFTDNELEEAYKIYGELYQMDTPFASLPREIAIRLKDPLVLKIACTNYLGLELPDSMLTYSSVSLFEKMLQDVSRSYAGKQQFAIIKELSRFILSEYERGIPTDRISDRQLREAYHDEKAELHAMAKLIYKKDDISVAYGELLNKPERPILRLVEDDSGEGHLQFIYERFLEFMLALVFVEREKGKLQDKCKNIPAEIFIRELQTSSTNVVFIGAMRNALIMDYMQTRDCSVILRLASEFGENFEVLSLVTEMFNVLIRENYENELFVLLNQLISKQPEQGEELIEEYNAVDKKIESNQADDEVISEYNRLSKLLQPIIRLRKLVSASTVNGIFLTDYFNENLYHNDPFELLWKLISDPINDVSEDACLYVYYLSNKKYTLDYSPLRENLTSLIAHEMFLIIRKRSLLQMLISKPIRTQTIIFLETATRITTLLIIDALLSKKEEEREKVEPLLNEIRSVFRHITGNYNLVKIMMPFFQLILRKQITFQSIYVNNAIEYQTFWDDSIVPRKSEEGWDRESLKEVLVFIHHYNRYYKDKSLESEFQEKPDFSKYQNKILSAYKKADSFSYFALERIMVIMGACSWESISPIVDAFFSGDYRQNDLFDYSQMSMLYILFQVAVNADETNEEIISIYSRECEDWTRRCIGLFKGHNSHKANPTKLYKRNVMNWYCVVYSRHSGDGVIREGDERCVPVFYKLIDEAIAQKNKELLCHLIENISELVTDFGYIQTALELLKYIMVHFDGKEKVAEYDSIKLERGGIYQDELIPFLGKVLSTAKHYFPVEVDNFIKKDIVGLKFPGVSKYRGDILNYNPSGETLSDLFTHKFGNFLMWALLNEEAVDDFAEKAMSIAIDSPDCFKWFDQVVRLLFKDLFKVKL